MSIQPITVIAAAALGLVVGLAAGCDDGRDTPSQNPYPTYTSTGTNTGTSTDTGSGGSAGGQVGGGGNATGGSNQGGQAGGNGPGGAGGTEDCYDGVDNNGDSKIDCITPDPTCATVCADPCAAPKQIADPTVSLAGDNTQHTALGQTSCAASQDSGPANVYLIQTQQNGYLDVELQALEVKDYTLSVRTTSDDHNTEVRCSERVSGLEWPYTEKLKLAVVQGEQYYVVVEGYSLLNYGKFELTAKTRPIECGDAIIDDPEQCDDGNTVSGDGCYQCNLEESESEPPATQNDTWGTADTYVLPFYAEIEPADDLDYVAVTVAADNTQLVISTFDIGNGGCCQGLMDSYVALFDTNGQTELAHDDDSGDGYCATLTHTVPTAGTYYVMVSRAPYGPPLMTFVYALIIEQYPP